MQEPSVLDYLKSKLAPWKYPPVSIRPPDNQIQPLPVEALTSEADNFASKPVDSGLDLQQDVRLSPQKVAWPWRALLGLLLAFVAQRSLEVLPGRNWNTAALLSVAIYIIAAALIVWAGWRSEWQLAMPPVRLFILDRLSVRSPALFTGLSLALLAFLTASNNLFNLLNLGLLLLALACLVWAFWLPPPLTDPLDVEQAVSLSTSSNSQTEKTRSSNFAWSLAFLAVLGLSAAFRFINLAQVPGEMNSDHAEKIMDILRLLAGQTNIFFPNNGGREALQIYLVAGLHRFLGVELGFTALKTISSLAGFLSLPFIYLSGKEIANRRVGLLAMAFSGIAYWPNVVSRLGLRLPFYILFTAIIFYLVLRGMQTGWRNTFIWLGLALGLSMYGYSADRLLPLAILLGLVLMIAHERLPDRRAQVMWLTLLALVLAGIVFLPMLHYIIEQPGTFFYRTLTRLSGAEQPLSEPAALLFLGNSLRALAMFSWSDGEIWTTSIPYRPALEVISGALFWSGVALVLVNYLRRRRWQHLFLLLAIPLLMLPSTLAVAFPAENPNLYRTGGALIPVFLLVGLALDGLMRSIQNPLETLGRPRLGRGLAWSLAGILFLVAAFQGYELVFNQYRQQYNLSAWNTSEMGQAVRNFTGTFGKVDNVWVMGYPYWVDTRLVGMIAGYPLRDFALFANQVDQLPENPDAKLFIINPQDQESIAALQERFPLGLLTTYQSKTPGKEFLLFFVRPDTG